MRWLSVLTLVVGTACSDGADDVSSSTPTTPELARAQFQLTARILGPVEHDDDADLRITLTETNGVAARVNFFRLTCSNGVSQQWGAGNIAAERGSNRIAGNGQLVIVRHYLCPSSSRPFRILADLTDENGFSHRVESAPYHPDWPGA